MVRPPIERRSGSASPPDPAAVYSAEIELSEPLALPRLPVTAAGRRYGAARLLVRAAGEPLGFITLALDGEGLTAARVRAEVESELGAHDDGGAHNGAGAPASPPAALSVTVIVCTRNRAQELAACLEALRALEGPVLEFVIVDNAPDDHQTRSVVQSVAARDPRFRYAWEPRPGLSRARNRGLRLARGEIVAYVDDDVRVDPRWVSGILRGFARRGDVACVTGLVASASLEHRAERFFDARVWWSSSCSAQVFDLDHGPGRAALHPWAAGAFGTGANFSFRTSALRQLGGFDEALGAGSPARGGEDLDAFVRVLRSGYAIGYEPAAITWHYHRATEEDLHDQMYAYGTGLSAYLFKYLSSRATRLHLLGGLFAGLGQLALLAGRSRRAGEEASLPPGLWWAEMRGLAAGPWAYLRARSGQDRGNRLAVAP